MFTISALWGRLGRHSRHIKRIIRSLVLKKESTLNRINQMSSEEGANLLANLRLNAIPPYRLHTHPVEFTIHTFGIDGEIKVGLNTPDSRRSLYDLGMDRVKEIANTVLTHPSLGDAALNAMLDGRRVVINVQRHPKRETKPEMPAVSVQVVEVNTTSGVDDVQVVDENQRAAGKSRRKQQSAVSRALLN